MQANSPHPTIEENRMADDKFLDLKKEAQIAAIRACFQFREGAGWFTAEGVFVGKDADDVIAALVDLEAAEIDAIGDCMSGCCMVTPRLEDFVRRS